MDKVCLSPGINDDDESLHRYRAFLDTLDNVERVEVLLIIARCV